MLRPITGQEFSKALIAAGIIRQEDLASHLVIDVPHDGVVKLYVERFGDERLLSVAPGLNGAVEVRVGAP